MMSFVNAKSPVRFTFPRGASSDRDCTAAGNSDRRRLGHPERSGVESVTPACVRDVSCRAASALVGFSANGMLKPSLVVS